MGAAAIPIIAAVVGAGAQMYNTNQVNKRQDQALAASINDQNKRQRDADARVNLTLDRQQGSNSAGDQASAMSQYLAQLRRTQGQATAGLDQVGAVSDRYAQGASEAGRGIQDYSSGIADIFSRIDAPNMQRQREGIEFGRLGGDLGTIGYLSDSDRYLGDLRMRAIRRNPWIDALGSAASSYGGSGYGGGSSSGGYGGRSAAGGGNAPGYIGGGGG